MALPYVPEINIPEVERPPVLGHDERSQLVRAIKQQLEEQDAVLIAHYYTDPTIQALAEETGGIVADSLKMAQFGNTHPAQTLVVAGVYFMGETAKILTPHKRVLMPALQATCSLDLGCPADSLQVWRDEYPDRQLVVYANTSAAVKAMADWVVTSSVGKNIVQYLTDQGQKILWAPDKYLGDYIQRETSADMISWQGSCIVHEEFRATALKQLKQEHPEAAVLVHPESPAHVIALADYVGSTSQLIQAAQSTVHSTCIVATEQNIFYKMQQAVPDKLLIIAPTGGQGATCRSCGHCPWMAMNTLINLEHSLRKGDNEIFVDEAIIAKAQLSLGRMLDFATQQGTV